MLHLVLTNGRVRKSEIYYGSSFLSQSANCYSISINILKILVISNNFTERTSYKK